MSYKLEGWILGDHTHLIDEQGKRSPKRTQMQGVSQDSGVMAAREGQSVKKRCSPGSNTVAGA